MKTLLKLVILFVLMIVSSCLDFGDDIELSGAEFDQTKLAEVSKLTSLKFPEGSQGVEYFYMGEGIDPALAAKIVIPDAKVEEFMQNSIFKKGDHTKVEDDGVGYKKDWWKPSQLQERVDRKIDLSNSVFLEVASGRYDNQFIVYLFWFTV